MNRIQKCALSTLILAVVEIHGQAPATKAPPAPQPASPTVAAIVEFGEYSTTDSSSFKPTWTFVKATTQIVLKSNNGFGIRYFLPGPYTEDRMLASITIAGGFGPPGVIGYEFKGECRVKDNRCVGEMIVPGGGPSPVRPGDCTITVKYKDWTLTKTFKVSN